MKGARPEPGGVQLFEESILLLRSASAQDWLIYFSGAIPFVTALLWFCTGALRDINPEASLSGGALGVALLFLWKQLAEALFSARIHARLTGAGEFRTTAAAVGKAVIRLTAVQPWSALMLILALLATLPFAAAMFFFRGFSLFALIDPENAVRRAWQSARSRQAEAWRFAGLMLLVCGVLYVNFFAGALTGALLSKSLFGFESLLSDPAVLARSSTIHLSITLLVYLCTDALFAAAAVLRCFQTDSIRTGADLLAILRRPAAIAALIAITLCVYMPLAAQTDPMRLDKALDETLARREFAWRMPPTELTDPPAAVGWMNAAWKWLGAKFDALGKWLDEWLRRQPPPEMEAPRRAEGPSAQAYRFLMGALILVAAVGLIVIWLESRKYRGRVVVAASEARPAVDVGDESTLADHLSEDSWLSLADDLAARGDYRLALRALYLSGLRLLSERKLVTIQRWKSGYEYMTELKRRARQPALAGPPFQHSIRLFELGWYGFHPVNQEMIDELRTQLKDLRTHADA